MLLNTAETKFAKASSIEIPASFYNRILTGCEEIDLMFGSATVKGLMAGSTIAITGTPGAGKCHAGDQIIEIFSDDDLIEDIKRFLSTRTPS